MSSRITMHWRGTGQRPLRLCFLRAHQICADGRRSVLLGQSPSLTRQLRRLDTGGRPPQLGRLDDGGRSPRSLEWLKATLNPIWCGAKRPKGARGAGIGHTQKAAEVPSRTAVRGMGQGVDAVCPCRGFDAVQTADSDKWPRSLVRKQRSCGFVLRPLYGRGEYKRGLFTMLLGCVSSCRQVSAIYAFFPPRRWRVSPYV